MKQTPLSSPGLTGRPSIPETFEIDREAAAYWIARSSRATTVLIVAAALPSPSFFLGLVFGLGNKGRAHRADRLVLGRGWIGRRRCRGAGRGVGCGCSSRCGGGGADSALLSGNGSR